MYRYVHISMCRQFEQTHGRNNGTDFCLGFYNECEPYLPSLNSLDENNWTGCLPWIRQKRKILLTSCPYQLAIGSFFSKGQKHCESDWLEPKSFP